MPTFFSAERRHLLEIISGLTEGIILLDTNGHIAWANDTALAMHGAQCVADLGRTAAGFRKAFILRYRDRRMVRAAHYPMDRALRGETFDDLVVRVTRRGDKEFQRLHQIRSLALADSRGRIEGIVLVLQDQTDRYHAEERFERAFATNPAPALICRLSDLRYIKVNQGFLQMTGFKREDLIDRTAYDFDALGEGPGRAAAVAHLAAGGTIPQTETLLHIQGGAQKLVIVAGQPIEVGDDACMLFTFNDLDPRKQMEDALRHSEARFSTAFRLAPVPMALFTPTGAAIEVNEAFTSVLGYPAQDMLGKPGAMAMPWVDAQGYQHMMQSVAQGDAVHHMEAQWRTQEGAIADCLVSAEPVQIQDQRCVLCVVQDMTEHKRTETELFAAIEAVMRDTSWFSRTIIEKLAQIRSPAGDRQAGTLADLTAREREVLGLISQGLNDAEIAAALGLARNTVRNHVSALYAKLGVHRRSAAIVWARQRGITGRPAAGPSVKKH